MLLFLFDLYPSVNRKNESLQFLVGQYLVKNFKNNVRKVWM